MDAKDNRFYREFTAHNEVKYLWGILNTVSVEAPQVFSDEVNKYLKDGFTLKETIVACDCIVQVLVKEKPLSEYTAEEARIYNASLS